MSDQFNNAFDNHHHQISQHRLALHPASVLPIWQCQMVEIFGSTKASSKDSRRISVFREFSSYGSHMTSEEEAVGRRKNLTSHTTQPTKSLPSQSPLVFLCYQTNGSLPLKLSKQQRLAAAITPGHAPTTNSTTSPFLID